MQFYYHTLRAPSVHSFTYVSGVSLGPGISQSHDITPPLRCSQRREADGKATKHV